MLSKGRTIEKYSTTREDVIFLKEKTIEFKISVGHFIGDESRSYKWTIKVDRNRAERESANCLLKKN